MAEERIDPSPQDLGMALSGDRPTGMPAAERGPRNSEGAGGRRWRFTSAVEAARHLGSPGR